MFNEETKKLIEQDKIKLRKKLGRELKIIEVAEIQEKYLCSVEYPTSYSSKAKKIDNLLINHQYSNYDEDGFSEGYMDQIKNNF